MVVPLTDPNKLVGVFVPRPVGQDEREADLRKRDMSSYVGGQAEIHVNGGVTSFGAGGKVLRGEIASIAIRSDDLVIRFAWLGAMEQPGQWTNDSELDLALGLPLVSACSSPDEGGRTILEAPIVDQMIVLYPRGYRSLFDGELSALDPAVVRGLHRPE
jgi:hypothetical protein